MDKSKILALVLLAVTLVSGILIPNYDKQSFDEYMQQSDGRQVDEISTIWFHEFQKQQKLGHDYKKADKIAVGKALRLTSNEID